MQHTNEMIRKKAVMVIISFNNVQPVVEMDVKMKRALCDKDPSVMAAALNFFVDQSRIRPNDFKDLT